ncbi:hypothetical protein ACFQZJ_15405 [Maribacter chungangensis]|uniref:Uncharacterized protein n=1 Tax=Maribacter chungangensis TaxID=1069117 RepID=A0ABW3B6C8_9FLAO
MHKLTDRLPIIITATGTLFFSWLTYYFNFNGDGGADGLSMFFFIVFATGASLLFLLGFLGAVFFTNIGETVFKGILLIIVFLCVGYVASVVYYPATEGIEVETRTVND